MIVPDTAPPASPAAIAALPLPIERPADLKLAMTQVAALRRDPAQLFAWNPEDELTLPDRQRWELATSLALVQSLGTGDGGLESRVKACAQLYALHTQAPYLAVMLGERLLRSRLIMGATDVETFWLAVSFAHGLAPLLTSELAELSWQYLNHAPFAVDPFTALRFAQLSRNLSRQHFPHWPLELIESLLSRPYHADLGATLLEAVVCSLLKVRSMDAVAKRLQAPLPYPAPPLLISSLELLAHHYVRTQADQIYAREVLRAASQTASNPTPFQSSLASQTFDIPYPELYKLVSEKLHRPADLDTLYRSYVEADQLPLARRLVECELVRRLDPWRFGGMHGHVRKAIHRVLAGADMYYPRVRELTTRLAILHSRTRFYTDEAQHLAQRVASLPQYTGDGAPLSQLREELALYLQESDPRHLLARERSLLLERWDELTEEERALMDGVQAWMDQRFQDRPAHVRVEDPSQQGPDSITVLGEGELEWSIEKILWQAYRFLSRPVWIHPLKKQVESIVGQGFGELRQADAGIVSALARSFAYSDRALAAANGALAGLLGGPWGMAFDMAGLLTLSARACTRIGTCFGIEPGSREGFRFLLDALTLSVSTRAGEGLGAYLMDQRPRAYRVLTVNGVLYGTGLMRQSLRRNHYDGMGGGMARRLVRTSRILGLGFRERQWARVLPLVGAVIAGGADYLFMRTLTEATLHLGARHWVLSRHGLLTLPPDLEDATDEPLVSEQTSALDPLCADETSDWRGDS